MKKQLYITTLFCFTAFSIQSSAGKSLNRFEIARVKSGDFEAEVKRRIKNKQAQAARYKGVCPLNRGPIQELERILTWRKGLHDSGSNLIPNKNQVQLVQDILRQVQRQHSQNDFFKPAAGGVTLGEYNRKKQERQRLLSLKTMQIGQLAQLSREKKVSRVELQDSGRTRELMAFFAQEAKERRVQEEGKQQYEL